MGEASGKPAPYVALGPVEEFEREALLEYVQSLLWTLRLADAFWFLNVEDHHGLAAAEARNEAVWDVVGKLATRDLVQRFGLRDRGLRGFREIYALFPWARILGHELQWREDGSLTLEVPRCPAQEGRRKHGLDDYVCQAMHQAEFEAIAREVDPAIRVECLHAPPYAEPASRPRDLDCAWRFSMRDTEATNAP